KQPFIHLNTIFIASNIILHLFHYLAKPLLTVPISSPPFFNLFAVSDIARVTDGCTLESIFASCTIYNKVKHYLMLRSLISPSS
ncbi:hypothetical protein, partial [Candidatus Cyrtobacter comes]|uniref:hypothetical protein n=1 Tax=Candidatus Cyrtobacter comes TaxID=675776 RepID=UPI002ACE08DE